MFSIIKQRAEVSYFSPRDEKHGQDNPVGAADVGLVMELDASVLDEISNGLRWMLYTKPAAPSQKELAAGAAPDAEGPQLRFGDAIDRIKLTKEYAGYGCRLACGDLASTLQVKLDPTHLKKLLVEPMQGGTVKLSVQVQWRPTPEQVANLFQMMGREVTVCLMPAGVEFLPLDDAA